MFEESEVTEYSEKPLGVRSSGKRITCNYMVLATHTPVKGNADFITANLFQMRRMAYSTLASVAGDAHRVRG